MQISQESKKASLKTYPYLSVRGSMNNANTPQRLSIESLGTRTAFVARLKINAFC